MVPNPDSTDYNENSVEKIVEMVEEYSEGEECWPGQSLGGADIEFVEA